ncbi:MAG: MmcQ/YjbR family DNA-binding protein [Candidatus Gastranaerophilales bacterium]|nr:MmcQ/YjbR family DNA-binding protein [Candidatus Gastranaerophilales bacterium]
MNEKELIKRCLINKDAIETYPFSDKRYGKIPVLRHKSNNKWFGLIFYLDNILYINLKAEPETISILQDQYPDIVTSAWHMNKSHWCKVDVNKIDLGVLDAIIKKSFDITANKKRFRKS